MQKLGDFAPENLFSIHKHEEDLRARSLTFLLGHAKQRDHLHLSHQAMGVIYGLAHDYPNEDTAELVMQLLGVRLFNAAATSLKLALSGYYQVSFAQLRDALETYFLIDYLGFRPNEIEAWQAATKAERSGNGKFSPGAIRRALDQRDGLKSGNRKKHYDLLSTYATHVTFDGFKIVRREELAEIGPFYSERHLEAWGQEQAKIIGPAAQVFKNSFKVVEPNLAHLCIIYRELFELWLNQYVRQAH